MEMKAKKVYHVTPSRHPNCWDIKVGKRVVRTDSTKKMAFRVAVTMAKNHWELYNISSQVMLHNQDGEISEKRTYGTETRYRNE